MENSPGALVISTEALLLRYDKKPFSQNGLCVSLRGNTAIIDSLWRYGDQLENLGGTLRTLDKADGPVPLEQGVLSRNGIAVVDDSRTLVFEADDWVQPRCKGKIDLYVFAYGRNYRSCLKDFYRLTGPASLLPRYALGNWWSRFYRYTEQSYKELIEHFENDGIILKEFNKSLKKNGMVFITYSTSLSIYFMFLLQSTEIQKDSEMAVHVF
jgi:alpha-glucosidase (family GH31 glycosyl hydrolase)